MYEHLYERATLKSRHTLTNRGDASNGEQKRLGECPVPVPLVDISIIFDGRVAAFCHNKFVKHHQILHDL